MSTYNITDNTLGNVTLQLDLRDQLSELRYSNITIAIQKGRPVSAKGVNLQTLPEREKMAIGRIIDQYR
jgi:hypothetical protein